MNTDFKGIQAVTLDAGGTMVAPWPSVGHVYAQVAGEFGLPGVSPALLNAGFARAWRSREDFDYSPPAWFALVRQAFGPLASNLPPDYYPAVYQRFAEAAAWQVFPDVLPALDQLANLGVKLGIVSNWDERLLPLLGNLRLKSYFESIVVSSDIGFTKPSPVIFEQAARQLGCAPSAILHVGDSPSEDLAGARAAGLKACLLDRSLPSDWTDRLGSLADIAVLIETR